MMGSKLIVLIVIVLGVIALAQLVRIYELSTKLRKRGENEIPDADNKINAKLLLTFGILYFASFIYLMVRFGWTGRGEAASLHGQDVDKLMVLNLVIIMTVFFLTNGLLFLFAYKYVRKPGVKAYYFPHNNKLEMVWTIVPASVLAVIIILGLRVWNNSTSAATKDAIRIELFSKQFDWTARYSGKDNQLGKFDYKLTTDANELALMTAATIDSAINNMQYGPMGINAIEKRLNDKTIMLVPEDREKMETDLYRKQRFIRLLKQMKQTYNPANDALAYDDIIQKDTLYLCANKEYEFNFRSKDVIHSAHFPHFRAQMNTVPGMTTKFKFTPTITTKDMSEKVKDENFNYVLLCNKICGGAHYKMKMFVVVLPQAEYNAWMASKAKSTFKDTFFASAAAPAADASAPAIDSTATAAL